MRMVEDFSEFSARHGSSPLNIGGRLIFSDGAQCDADSGTIRKEPPSDKTELLKLKRTYVQEKLQRAEDDFHALKSATVEQAALAAKYRNLPSPHPDAALELRQLKKIVQQFRTKLEKIDKQLAETPEAQVAQQRQEQIVEHQQRQHDFMNEVSSIEI